MKITVDWTYDAPPAEVWAMTASKDFQDRKCKEAGAASYQTSVTADGDRTVIVATREMATDGVPEQLRAVVGRTVTITETQTWGPDRGDGSREATIQVVMKGQPVGMEGRAVSRPEGSGTRIVIDGDVKARIPLFGGRVEKAVAPVIKAAASSEAAVGREWLANAG
ncbi:DUF2505 domain-containing protein [Luteipulveratus mongoliensis]|uniref:DUF2505 domain-containing protein n=1 Tax=Luteipulveratus mongoliensis TaxID=571913 RepID=A0A0K1JI43_9MICO|nr:DUF2505 domain-containing protein [Luteipulveratus mongoliensis]AKU16248.1 hypothetical protein VV02_10875 [Luteipulveratus mongoliensis]